MRGPIRSIAIACIAFMGCTSLTINETAKNPLSRGYNLSHATGFALQEENGLTKLIIFNPWKPTELMSQFYLWPDSLNLPDSLNNKNVILTPVKRLVALSATQWGGLLKLGQAHIIKGVSESHYIQNEHMRSMIKNGEIVNVASDGVYFLEQLAAIKPELIFYSPDLTGVPIGLVQSEIPLIPWPDYFEPTPLGRAEWIKILGALSQQETQANQIFDSISNAYNILKQLVVNQTYIPTIFSDKIFAGQWYVPGGRSYIASVFRDAGAKYVFADNGSTASFPLDIEAIFARSASADYWRIAQATDTNYSYFQLKNENELYERFSAFQNKKIIFCNTAKTAYFEKSPLEPHIVLADFIAIFYPHLLPHHTAVYHHLLN